MDFKERLRELRLEKSLTQAELGGRLCVTKMCVSHWEHGDSEPSISQLLQLSEILDVSIDYLVGREN